MPATMMTQGISAFSSGTKAVKRWMRNTPNLGKRIARNNRRNANFKENTSNQSAFETICWASAEFASTSTTLRFTEPSEPVPRPN